MVKFVPRRGGWKCRWASPRISFASCKGSAKNQLASEPAFLRPPLCNENDRVRLGVERPEVLARALKCYPAVLVSRGGKTILNLRHNHAFERSARQRRCRVPWSLRSRVPRSTRALGGQHPGEGSEVL